MTKTILLTGATDGIGLETAKLLAAEGHSLLLHGRNPEKLKTAAASLSTSAQVSTYQADLSDLGQTKQLAEMVAKAHPKLDIIINNAGVFKTTTPLTPSGLDVRFVVNTLAPFLLTKRLLPHLAATGRVVNVSSAAQAPVEIEALEGRTNLSDNAAYAQSKLAITMWSRALAESLGQDGPVIVAVNPASFLGSKMVKDAYGMAGNDLSIGADILVRAALSDEFANATGQYYDNDNKRFAPPHPDALDPAKVKAVMTSIQSLTEAWF